MSGVESIVSDSKPATPTSSNNSNSSSFAVATNREREIIEITEGSDEFFSVAAIPATNHPPRYPGAGALRTAIGEGGNHIPNSSLFSIDISKSHRSPSGSGEFDVVYVAVGHSYSSWDALLWTLRHATTPKKTLLYLVHIFSEIKFIPSPFGGGRVPRNQVSQDLVENYAAREANKRRQLLTNYFDKCTSHLVQVETILIESNSVPNAIVELISILDIPKLILGISKSSLRKTKAGKYKGSTVAHQVLHNAPVECQVKIICEGKDVSAELQDESPACPSTPNTNVASPSPSADQHPQTSLGCCFGANFAMD